MLHTTTRHTARRLFLIAISLCILSRVYVCESAFAQSSTSLSLTLPEAIDLALKQNRSLKLGQLSIIDKEHKKEIARSAYFPQIKNQSTVLHLTELEGVTIPAGALVTMRQQDRFLGKLS